MDFIKPKDLGSALARGNDRLKPYRDMVKRGYEAMLGDTAAGRGTDSKTRRPINLTAQMRLTLEPYLAFEFPRADVTATLSEQDFEAELHALDLDTQAEEMGLGDVLADLAIDALMGPLAIARVGLRTGYEAGDADGSMVPMTYPFVSRIALDDYIPDPDARTREEMLFEYSVNEFMRSVAVDQQLFGVDPDEFKNDPAMQGLEDLVMTKEEAALYLESVSSSDRREKSSAGMTTSHTSEAESPFEKIAVYDGVVYTHQGTYLAVMACDGDDPKSGPDKYLMLTPFKMGKARSPFETMRFHRLPGSILGHSPEEIQRDLALATDELATLMIKRMKKMKGVNYYKRGAGTEDAMQIRKAEDEGWVALDDTSNIGRIEHGGVPDGFYQGLAWLGATHSEVGGQLRLTAGQVGGAGGDTATEYEGQVGRVQERLAHMQKAVQRLATRIFDHLGWWSCENPLQERTLRYLLGNGAVLDLPFSQKAGTKSGDYWKFAFRAEAYSMQSIPPAVRIARIERAAQQIMAAAQAAAQAAQLGLPIEIDPSVLAKMYRRELRAPELERFIRTSPMPVGEIAAAQVGQARMNAPMGPSLGVRGTGQTSGPRSGQARTRPPMTTTPGVARSATV